MTNRNLRGESWNPLRRGLDPNLVPDTGFRQESCNTRPRLCFRFPLRLRDVEDLANGDNCGLTDTIIANLPQPLTFQ